MSKKIAYHIDRLRTLHEGQVIQLNTTHFSDMTEISKHFKNGLSEHGIRYFSDLNAFANIGYFNSTLIEHCIETMRLISFPNVPSRFQSLFAIPTLDELDSWEELYGDYPIYEVEYDTNNSIQLDASNLKGGINEETGEFSPCYLLSYAKNYLSGKIGENPKMEILIPLPVKIGKRVR